MKFWGCIFLSLIVTYCWFMCPEVNAKDLSDNVIDGENGIISGTYYTDVEAYYYYVEVSNGENLWILKRGNYYELNSKNTLINVRGYYESKSNGEKTEFDKTLTLDYGVQYGNYWYHHNTNENIPPTAFFVFSVFDSNIPIFEDNENLIQNVIEYSNNGNYENAYNYDDVVPSLEVPAPYNITLSDTGKNKSLSNDMVFNWKCGFNENFQYDDISYEGVLNISYSVTKTSELTGNSITNGSFEVVVPLTKYSNDYATFRFATKTITDKFNQSINLLGIPISKFSLDGYLTTCVFRVRDVVTSDNTNKSEYATYTYNYLTGTEENTRTQNVSEDTPEIYNPNVDGPITDNNTSSTTTGNNGGVTVNVTQNNNKGNSFWDTIANGLNIVLTIIGNKLGGLFDGITDTVKNIGNLFSPDNLIPGGSIIDLIKSITGLIGGNGSSGSGSGSGSGSAGVGGLVGFIDNLSTSLNGLLTNVLSPFTTGITSLINSVSGVLSAGSELGQYITSGFGLLGNNGYIAMFGASMSFIPQEIWSIITLAVASGCSLFLSAGIVNFIRR